MGGRFGSVGIVGVRLGGCERVSEGRTEGREGWEKGRGDVCVSGSVEMDIMII